MPSTRTPVTTPQTSIIQFTPRTADVRQPGGRAGLPADVIRLADRKRQQQVQQQAQGAAATLRWVSPFEHGLLQAQYVHGAEAAAEYLLARADTTVSRLSDSRGEWHLLWVTGEEADFFDYMEKAGVLAAAKHLLSRVAETAAQRATRHAAAMKAVDIAIKGNSARLKKQANPAAEAKPARKKRSASTSTSVGAGVGQ